MKRRVLLVSVLFLLLPCLVFSQTGTKKRRPLPYEYGRVILTANAEGATMPAVPFDHWSHRANFTCRLCHVDIGFAMKAQLTGITTQDIRSGYYCGTCHNGRMEVGGRKVFAACEETTDPSVLSGRCRLCHSFDQRLDPLRSFAEFSAGLPKARFGNGIDWEKAEISGQIQPRDYLEGISFVRTPMTAPKDFNVDSAVEGMPEIIFSHKKHTLWNGCESCHPEIFTGIKKGLTKYSMLENYEGKYCGQCHATVAFPLTDCQRCHAKPVQ